MWAISWANQLRRILSPLSRGGLWLAGGGVILIVAVTVIDVFGRYFFNAPLQGSIAISEITLIIVLFAPLTAVALRKGHIRIGVVVDKFPKTAQLAISTCGDLITIAMVSIIARQSVQQALYLLDTGQSHGTFNAPMWPFAVATAVFLGIMAIAVFAEFLDNLGKLVAGKPKHYLNLIYSMIIAGAMLLFAFVPAWLPKVDATTAGIIGITLMFVLLFLRVHIGAVLAFITLLGLNYLIGVQGGLVSLGMGAQTTASNYLWAVAPMFMWMGLLVTAAGFSRDLYHAAYRWIGHTPGGLASATVVACGGFAAICGTSTPGVLAFSGVALPEMKRYNYDAKLATGCICAGATLGLMIPPSVTFIWYSFLTGASIGKLFIAGILPGLIIVAAFVLLILIRCKLNPSIGPPGPKTTFREKVTGLKYSWLTALLFLVVIGGIYVGVFTPNEAAAVGVFFAAILGFAMKRLNLKQFFKTLQDSISAVAMIFFIFVFAMALNPFLAVTRLPFALSEFVGGLAIPPLAVLLCILLLYFILGCIMEITTALILTLPIIFSAVMAIGYDPIWFGVIICLAVETALLTPPIGFNVFILSGIVKEVSGYDISMYGIFRGVVPFWLVLFGLIGLLIAFPQIVLFLPNLMSGG